MKKKLAIILSVVMMMSLISIPVSANTAGDFDVDGNIVVLDHVFEVTIPTSAFTFVADPEGALGGDAGAITFTNGTPSFINRSSAPVLLGIEARITTATSGDTQVFPVAANAVGTAGSTTRNVNVTVTPSTDNVNAVGGTFGGTSNATDLALTPTLFTFALPAAVYNIEGTVAAGNLRRVISDTPNLQGTQIRLAGNLTPNPVIWTGNEDLGVRVRFSFIPAPVTLPGSAMSGSAHLRQIQTDQEVFDTMVLASNVFIAVDNIVLIPVADIGGTPGGMLINGDPAPSTSFGVHQDMVWVIVPAGTSDLIFWVGADITEFVAINN